MARNISFTLKYWKQNGPREKGHFDTHEMKNIPDDTSFLEMLDILNEELIEAGQEPFVFDHDLVGSPRFISNPLPIKYTISIVYIFIVPHKYRFHMKPSLILIYNAFRQQIHYIYRYNAA